MSKKFEQIGRISAAVIALPEKHLGLTLDIINKMADSEWKVYLAEIVRQGPRRRLSTRRNMFDSTSYFITRDGLWASSEFTSRILSVYNEPIEKRGLEGVSHFDLPKNMYDDDIIKEYLGGEEEVRKHAFTPDQIADLVDKQKDGGEGELLNNGYTNIFYVIGEGGRLFAVCVGWGRGKRSWGVSAYELGESGFWPAGNRIFRNKS